MDQGGTHMAKTTKLTRTKQESQDRMAQASRELAAATTPAALDTGSSSETEKKPKKKPIELPPGTPNKLKMGLTDLGGSVFAQGFNEGFSYLIREAGKWSVDGFIAQQNDYLQAVPQSIGGLLWYLVELYGIGKAPPSAFKVGRMEAAKLMSNLGMAKFFQALRSRSADAKAALTKARAEAAQYQADNKAQADQLERMQTQLAELQKQQKAGGGATGGGGR